MKKKIAVIGSYAVGVTIIGKSFPEPGQTVPGHDFQLTHGGKGSNQAVAAARMGADVFYGTCVGKDDFGKKALGLYREEGIHAENVRASETGLSTGVGLIFVNEEGENEIIIDFAANKEFSRADVDRMMPDIRDCRLLLMQLECSMETVEYAAERCEAEKIPFVLNPAPYAPLSEKLLSRCSYLTPNETEARQILGLDPKDVTEDEKIAVMLREKGVKNVIMTLGSRGVCVCTGQKCTRVPGLRVEALDSTGAGDTFTGAFCVAVAEGRDVTEAVKFGNAAAGISVTKYGVIESIPMRKEAEEKLGELK